MRIAAILATDTSTWVIGTTDTDGAARYFQASPDTLPDIAAGDDSKFVAGATDAVLSNLRRVTFWRAPDTPSAPWSADGGAPALPWLLVDCSDAALGTPTSAPEPPSRLDARLQGSAAAIRTDASGAVVAFTIRVRVRAPVNGDGAYQFNDGSNGFPPSYDTVDDWPDLAAAPYFFIEFSFGGGALWAPGAAGDPNITDANFGYGFGSLLDNGQYTKRLEVVRPLPKTQPPTPISSGRVDWLAFAHSFQRIQQGAILILGGSGQADVHENGYPIV